VLLKIVFIFSKKFHFDKKVLGTGQFFSSGGERGKDRSIRAGDRIATAADVERKIVLYREESY